MIYPNLRYGDPAALRAYAAGKPLRTIARQLRRHPRTVHDWMTGKRRMPWWVPELLMLRDQVAFYELRHMGIRLEPRAVQRSQDARTPAPTNASNTSTAQAQNDPDCAPGGSCDGRFATPRRMRAGSPVGSSIGP